MKTCCACKTAKLRDEFISKASSPDGLNSICRSCDSARRIQRRIDKGTRRPDPPPGRKWCSKCDQEKLLDEFYMRQSGHQAGKPHAHCRNCIRADNIERARRRGVSERVEALPDSSWRRRLAVRYSITFDDYERLTSEQGGRCPGCLRTAEAAGRRLTVDHDHSCCPGDTSCGRCVRGTLCWQCNITVGHARDSAEVLRNLATYLDAYASASPSSTSHSA